MRPIFLNAEGNLVVASCHTGKFLWSMKQVLTLVVKLQASTCQQQLLDDTANAFASACNWVNQNVNPKLTNKNSTKLFATRMSNSSLG